MNRLLLVSADAVLHKSVQLMLSHVRVSVHRADPGRETVELARLGGFDLIMLDIDAPHGGGTPVPALLPQMRAAVRGVPFLLVHVAGAEDDTLAARCAPCQQLAKPFHRNDLIARITSLLKRKEEPISETLDLGRLTLDLTFQKASVDGQTVPLTGKEYQILEFLALREGTTLTKNMFLSHLYPDGNEPDMKIIDVFVCKLRKKLNAVLGDTTYVHTIWGRGYVLRRPKAGNGAKTAGRRHKDGTAVRNGTR